MMLRRFILTLVSSSLFSTATYADVIKHKKLNFIVRSANLTEDIHYSFAQGQAEELKKNYPHIAKLDSLGFLKEKNSSVIVSKVSYVVKKPIGFFDHENLVEEKLMASLLGDQKVKKLDQHSFMVDIPGKDKAYYKLRIYVDSDDVSTLPHSRINESITSFKKLDVISQSAPSISFKEMSEFSDHAWGSVCVSSYIPLKENKTLVISYYVTSLRTKGDVKKNEANLVEEFKSNQKVLENFN